MASKELVITVGKFTDIFKSFIPEIREMMADEPETLVMYAEIEEAIDEEPIKYINKYGGILHKFHEQLEDMSFYVNDDIHDKVIIAIQDLWEGVGIKQKNIIDERLNGMLDLFLTYHTVGSKIKGNIVDLVNNFNRSIKKMVNEMSSRFKGDHIVVRAKKLVSLATDQAPVWVVGEMGMHLFKYYKQIAAKDESFFLENNYDKEMAKTMETNPEAGKLSAHLMPMVKKTWIDLDKEDQDDYYKRIYGLLVSYIEYKILC